MKRAPIAASLLIAALPALAQATDAPAQASQPTHQDLRRQRLENIMRTQKAQEEAWRRFQESAVRDGVEVDCRGAGASHPPWLLYQGYAFRLRDGAELPMKGFRYRVEGDNAAWWDDVDARWILQLGSWQVTGPIHGIEKVVPRSCAQVRGDAKQIEAPPPAFPGVR